MNSKVTGEGDDVVVKKKFKMTKAGNLCVFVCDCDCICDRDCVCDMLMLVLGTC